MFGRAGVDGAAAGRGFGRASAASATSSTRSSAARPPAAGPGGPDRRPGSDLRYDLRITLRRGDPGTEKEIDFPALDRVRDLRAARARSRARTRRPAPSATAGRDPQGPPHDARPDGQRHDLPALPRRGQDRRDALRDLPRRRPGRARAGRSGSRSRPGSTRATRSGCRARARSAPAAGRPGSLYVAVHIQPHPSLKRDGTELFLEREISIAQAALGTTVTIPTIDGDEHVEIKPGTQPGAEIRLRGQGVPHLRRANVRGDLHVFVRVAVPTKLSKKQRELLEALRPMPGEAVDGGAAGSSTGSRTPSV